jgi:peptidyl-prolyl cis-trans isomerase C
MLGLVGLLSTSTLIADEAVEPNPAPQTLVMIDDFALTDVHFALFASQTGRNPSDAAGQIGLLNELVNHFMVANSAEGRALAKDPDVVAALEVARARLLAQTFVRAQIEANPVDAAELQSLYEQRYASASGMEYKARHILLDDEAAAQAVIAELDGGADFAELAKARSTGPSGSAGGDLGWFEPGQMVAPFADATSKLENGRYSETPVKTQFGWHVILREDSREVAPPALEEVEDELTQSLHQQRVAAAITRIREATRIEVQSPEE